MTEMRCPTHKCELVRRQSTFGPFYGCPEWPKCDIIGKKSQWDGNERYSTKAMRQARIHAHAAFDPIWESKAMTRREAYRWMARLFGFTDTRRDAHIEHLDEDQCEVLIEACGELMATGETR